MHESLLSKLGNDAAMNSTIATLVSAVEALRQDLLNQATTITEQGTTIVRLENTVDEQVRAAPSHGSKPMLCSTRPLLRAKFKIWTAPSPRSGSTPPRKPT